MVKFFWDFTTDFDLSTLNPEFRTEFFIHDSFEVANSSFGACARHLSTTFYFGWFSLFDIFHENESSRTAYAESNRITLCKGIWLNVPKQWHIKKSISLTLTLSFHNQIECSTRTNRFISNFHYHRSMTTPENIYK